MAETSQFAALLQAATAELQRNVAAAEAGAATLIHELVSAKSVALYGVGREGLAVKGLAMRLFHMGLKALVVGEMTAAPVGPGDLFVASAGPGYFSTVAALSQEARRAGARVLILTSQPTAAVQQLGDVAVQVPATCLPPSHEGGASSGGTCTAAAAAVAAGGCSSSTHEGVTGKPSPLLMGSSYELALQLFFDIVCVLLQQRLGLSAADMTARHTNLE